MVINIVPDKSGKEYSPVFCDWGYFGAGGGLVPGAHFSIDSPQQGQTFDYACHTLTYPCDESGQIGLILYDKKGNVKEVLKSRVFSEASDNVGMGGVWGNDIEFADITISSNVQPDDYITLATRKSASLPWLEVVSTLEAPLKKHIAEITKDVGLIHFINNVSNSKIVYLKGTNGGYVDLEPDKNVLECVRGETLTICVYDENQSGDVIITVTGKGLYGDTQTSVNVSGFCVYSDSYTISIDKPKEKINKVVNLVEAGRLHESLNDTPCSDIGSLTINGNINAEDLWFIRDNLKLLRSLDISEAKIVACEAFDPVETFRISGSDHIEDALPTYALTGLFQLNTLNLPKNLRHIESNSLMDLAISRIEIPSTVQSIGINVFYNCANLQTVICKMNLPPFINECVFTDTMCPARGILYVPIGTYDAYGKTEVWQDFAQIIEDENPPADNEIISYEGLKYRILGRALYLVGYDQSQLPNDVIIPESISVNGYDCSVLGIDDNAMQYARMRSFTMPNSITTIGSNIFTHSSVVKVKSSNNIKYLPCWCFDGDRIEELHLPENAESISNSIYCPALKKLHLPKKLHSETGYSGSIGDNFRNLEKITVDSENEEWCVHDGILYWKGLSHLILIPNTMLGRIIVPDETAYINRIENCNQITQIVFGDSIRSIGYTSIHYCKKLNHIEFNNDILFNGERVVDGLQNLESYTIRDFMWSYESTFSNLPSLKYVYLLNTNPVDFSNNFYREVNPQHDYYSPSLNPQAVIPDESKFYVPGGVKEHVEQMKSSAIMEEMWSYKVDKMNHIIMVKPLIDGLAIDNVIINGTSHKANSYGIYRYESANGADLDVVVEFTLHERQTMTTHYDAAFNALLSDVDFTKVEEITLDEVDKDGDVYTTSGVLLKHNCSKKDLKALAPGVYIINGKKVVIR